MDDKREAEMMKYCRVLGVILGYWDNAEENGNYRDHLGLYRVCRDVCGLGHTWRVRNNGEQRGYYVTCLGL